MPRNDYEPTYEENMEGMEPGVLLFNPFETIKFIDIKIVDDDRYEGDEKFSVVLFDAKGAELTLQLAKVTIWAAVYTKNNLPR